MRGFGVVVIMMMVVAVSVDGAKQKGTLADHTISDQSDQTTRLERKAVEVDYDHHSYRNPYSYKYNVADPKTLNNFEVVEQGDPHVVTGRYKVDLPDGRTQIVSYSVHPEKGYQAEVNYIGQAEYPDAPGYLASPYGPPEPIKPQRYKKYQYPALKSKQTAKRRVQVDKTKNPVDITNTDLFAESSEITYKRPERNPVKVEANTDPVKKSNGVEQEDSISISSSVKLPLIEEEEEPTPLAEPLSLSQPQVQKSSHHREARVLKHSDCPGLDSCLTNVEFDLGEQLNDEDIIEPTSDITATKPVTHSHVGLVSSEDKKKKSSTYTKHELKINEEQVGERETPDLQDDITKILISEIYDSVTESTKAFSYNPTTPKLIQLPESSLSHQDSPRVAVPSTTATSSAQQELANTSPKTKGLEDDSSTWPHPAQSDVKLGSTNAGQIGKTSHLETVIPARSGSPLPMQTAAPTTWSTELRWAQGNYPPTASPQYAYYSNPYPPPFKLIEEKPRKRNIPRGSAPSAQGIGSRFKNILYRRDYLENKANLHGLRPQETVIDIHSGDGPVHFTKISSVEGPVTSTEQIWPTSPGLVSSKKPLSSSATTLNPSTTTQLPATYNIIENVDSGEGEIIKSPSHGVGVAQEEDIDYYEDYNVFPFGARLPSVIFPKLNLLLDKEQLLQQDKSDAFESLVSATDSSVDFVETTITPVHSGEKVRLVSKGTKYIPEFVPSY